MLVLSAKNISKSFGVNIILENICFNVNDGDKIGVIGVNGAGKSTLFKIITGLLSPDEGEIIVYGSNTQIGYLDQNGIFESDKSVYEELISIFDDMKELEKKIHLKEHEISVCKDEPKLNKLMDEYAHLRDLFEKSGGFEYESRVKGVLTGLGFNQEEYTTPVSTLSGGEKTRVALARLLLRNPNILLLDEPTNHLDLNSCEWLENFLNSYKGTVLIISHDRYFLDKITNKTFCLKNGHITEYNGNYSYYAKQSKLEREIAEKQYKNQQKEIERIKNIIQTQKALKREKNVRMAESKQKMLDRMELIERPDSDDPQPYFTFSTEIESGNDVLEVHNLTKSFDHEIFRNVTFSIQKGERVALLGPNGSGKSTIFKILNNQLTPDDGYFEYGNNVVTAYYDQELSGLDPEKTVIDQLWDLYPSTTQTEVRSILGCFLFRGDDVFKKVSKLSGGEKARLSMAIFMLKNANLLYLDEPTNHLDINSKEALEDALLGYNGTIFTISHDRYFVNKIATRILELTPTGIINYQGNYEYYIEKKNSVKNNAEMQSEPIKTKTQEKLERKKEREERQKRQERKKKIAELEKSISDVENKIAQCEKLLCDPDVYSDETKSANINIEYNSLKNQLDELYDNWVKAAED